MNQNISQDERVSLIGVSSRRRFLQGSLACVAGVYAAPSLALPPQDDRMGPVEQRRLRVVNANTWEKLDLVYWRDGRYIRNHIGQLNYLMRDHRAKKSFLMDVKLYDFLFRLHGSLVTSEHIHILSAYRTPETNKYLRKTSLGVARKSLHVKGRAVDIYIPGIDPDAIQKAARQLELGGVGYYQSKGFVHLDTGYTRHWVRS
ncbi:MAG: DUF882 domain-containing protein [Granulosicoccus sp.]|nr:DUF882 domain-containing protein [Granulosicoccus sp.]